MPITFEHLGGSRKGQVEQLAGARIGVGRDPASALPFDPVADADVSTNHAEIRLEADGLYYVTDLGSRNGTFVDGARVTGRTMLPPGATVRFGERGPEVKCTYTPVYAPAPGPAAALPASAPSAPASKASAGSPMLIVGIVAGALLLLIGVVVLIVVLSGGEETPRKIASAPTPGSRTAAPDDAPDESAGAVPSATPELPPGPAHAAGHDDAVAPAGARQPGTAAAKPPAKRPELPPAPATDFYGDPLPEGAAARAGSIFALDGSDQPFAFLADERTIAVACDDDKVRMFDLETGGKVRELPGKGPLAISPDGKIVALVEARSVTLRSLETGAALRTLKTYPQNLAFAPGGRALAVWGNRETDYVRLFDVATGKEIRAWGKEPPPPPPPPPPAPPGSEGKAQPAQAPSAPAVARPAALVGGRVDWFGFKLGGFSADGATVAIFGNDDKGAIDVTLVDAVTGKDVRRASIPAWDREIGSATIAPDLTVGGFVPYPKAKGVEKGAFLEIYDLRTLKKRRSIGTSAELYMRYPHPALSRDGKRVLASSESDGSILCFDVTSGKEIWRVGARNVPPREYLGHREFVFAPDGRTFAAPRDEGPIEVRDAATGEEIDRITSYPLHGRVTVDIRIVFSPRGRFLAGSGRESLRVWDAATRVERLALDSGRCAVAAVAFSPDGATLATGSTDQALRTFDARTGRPLGSAQARGGEITGIAFPPDGKTIVSATNACAPYTREAFVQSWDAASLRERRKVPLEGCTDGSETRVALSPEGGFAAFQTRAGVHVVDVATGKVVRAIENHTPERIALSPRGERIALAGMRPCLGVWDVKTGKRLFAVDNDELPFFTVDISADGRFIAAPKGPDLLVWDLAHGKKRQSVRPEGASDRQEVRTLALSADGALLAAELWQVGLHVWDVASGKRLAAFPGHVNRDGHQHVMALAFSPDGTHLASCARDGTALVWRIPDR